MTERDERRERGGGRDSAGRGRGGRRGWGSLSQSVGKKNRETHRGRGKEREEESICVYTIHACVYMRACVHVRVCAYTRECA